MKYALCILTLFVSPAYAADKLPNSMLGKWASEPEACGEQASESGLTVEPRSVLFYEHGIEVRRVTKQKDGSFKASGYAVDDQGKARGSIVLKLVGDKLEAGGGLYHRCKSETKKETKSDAAPQK